MGHGISAGHVSGGKGERAWSLWEGVSGLFWKYPAQKLSPDLTASSLWPFVCLLFIYNIITLL